MFNDGSYKMFTMSGRKKFNKSIVKVGHICLLIFFFCQNLHPVYYNFFDVTDFISEAIIGPVQMQRNAQIYTIIFKMSSVDRWGWGHLSISKILATARNAGRCFK